MSKIKALVGSKQTAFVVALTIGLLIGHGSGTLAERHIMREQALSLQLAHYDARTGAFTWGGSLSVLSQDDVLPSGIFIDAQKLPMPKKAGKK